MSFSLALQSSKINLWKSIWTFRFLWKKKEERKKTKHTKAHQNTHTHACTKLSFSNNSWFFLSSMHFWFLFLCTLWMKYTEKNLFFHTGCCGPCLWYYSWCISSSFLCNTCSDAKILSIHKMKKKKQSIIWQFYFHRNEKQFIHYEKHRHRIPRSLPRTHSYTQARMDIFVCIHTCAHMCSCVYECVRVCERTTVFMPLVHRRSNPQIILQ